MEDDSHNAHVPPEMMEAVLGVADEAIGHAVADVNPNKRHHEGIAADHHGAVLPDDDDDEPVAKQARRGPPVRVPWVERLQQLEEYKREHGDLLIPIRYKKNPSLGKFVHNMREQFKLYHGKAKEGYKKKCSMTPERIKQLDDLGFAWTTQRPSREKENWETRLEQVKRYKEQYGDCLIPHGYDPDPSLAEWVHRQRVGLSKVNPETEENAIIRDRYLRLQEVGFNFHVQEDKWQEMYEELVMYKQKHGHCQVPTHYAPNLKLGRWVHTMRHQKRKLEKGRKTAITHDRIDKLTELGFPWEVRPSLERPRSSWQSRWDEAKAYFETHGHYLMPAETQLGQWCLEQRTRLRNLEKVGKDNSKRMGPDRVQLLHDIGFTKDTSLSKTTEQLLMPSEQLPSIEERAVELNVEHASDSMQV